MSDSLPQVASHPANPDRYKLLVVILTVVTTVITAVVSGLQADANIRASTSNNASQLYAIQASGELHRQGLQSSYDTTVFSNFLKDSQEATVLLVTSLQQQQSGDLTGSQLSQQRADVAQARADTARLFSIFYTDPRYAPTSADGFPNMQAYVTDIYATANDLVAKQNAAVDEYDRWNRKGDSYTSILAVLAVAFFLLGLAQALSPRLRLLFAVFGLVAMLSAGFWVLLVLVK